MSEQCNKADIFSPPWWRRMGIIVFFALLALLAYFLFQRFLRTAATIILLAALLTYLLQPLVNWLEKVSHIKRRETARIFATLLVYAAIAGAIFFVGAAIKNTVTANVIAVQSTWAGANKHVPQQLIHLQRWYLATVPHRIQLQLAANVRKEVGHISDRYIPRLVSTLSGLLKIAGTWVSILVELIFVPLVAFYFLTDGKRVREQTLFFISKQYHAGLLKYLEEIDRLLRRYVYSQFVLCFIAWAVVTISLLIMGIPGALLLGVIAGVSRAIPIVGPVVGGIPVLATMLLDPQWAGAFWWVLIGFMLLHFFESKFLMPRILGQHLDLHPVLIIVSLLVGYEVLGILGMFLAPPVLALIRYILAVRRSETPPPNGGDTTECTDSTITPLPIGDQGVPACG